MTAARTVKPCGHLRPAKSDRTPCLPEGFRAVSLDLSGRADLTRLPAGLGVRYLNLSGCAGLTELPPGLRCDCLDLSGSGVRSVPADARVKHKLDLIDCAALEVLPEGLRVGTLLLRRCTALTELPSEMRASSLDLGGCSGLAGWRAPARMRVDHLDVSGCARLTALPDGLKRLVRLDVSGCASLTRLPEGLRVVERLELAGSGLRGLPDSLAAAPLCWRGVAVDERIAFRPETLTVEEIVGERNAERRRVMLERLGYERFFARAAAEELDRDEDAGGERRLLRAAMPPDEAVVCVAVRCPSTGRQYLLRVPPDVRTCRQAAAWMAGFDDPGEYRPVQET